MVDLQLTLHGGGLKLVQLYAYMVKLCVCLQEAKTTVSQLDVVLRIIPCVESGRSTSVSTHFHSLSCALLTCS